MEKVLNATKSRYLIFGTLLAALLVVLPVGGKVFAINGGSLGLKLSSPYADSSPFPNVTGMAPGDSSSSYADYIQSGSLAAGVARLSISDVSPSALTTDPSNGLHVTVEGCLEEWAGGSCPGGAFLVLVRTPLAYISGTSGMILSGWLGGVGNVNHLKFTLYLPSGDDGSLNGKAVDGSIQGLSSKIIWSITEEMSSRP